MNTRNMRKSLLVLLALAIIGFGGYVGYREYLSVRQIHLIKQARHYLTKSDTRRALLCLQRVLRSNPRNVEACRLMADLSEAGRSPSALIWRNRVIELKPSSTKDRLALAQTALVLRDYASATNALAAVSASGRKTAAFHNTAGAIAAAANQVAEAEANFKEAARLEPTNMVPQLNLAIIRLHGTNANDLQEARTALERISRDPTNPGLRCEALRELVLDAMRFRQTDSALALSQELLQQTNSIFRDRLMRLDVLQATRSPEFKPALISFQHEATNDPGKIYELASWQMAKTSPVDALTWMRSLPRTTQTNQPVTLLMAECLASQKDWHGAQKWLEPQNWAELEFARHALLARMLREQDLSAAAKAEWDQALKATDNQKTSLVMLLRLAAQWKWQSEGEDLLWTIVNLYPGEQWANQALTQDLYLSGRTRSLMMFYRQQMKRRPSDLSVKNDLAMTALLLNAQELKPQDMAREVYELAPTNAAYASTYAFSLHLQHKDAEALKIMNRLPSQLLENPAIAGYYGLILKATGNGPRAQTYLNWAFKGHLLPEERKLFEAARAGT